MLFEECWVRGDGGQIAQRTVAVDLRLVAAEVNRRHCGR